jgi:hypothetical protein
VVLGHIVLFNLAVLALFSFNPQKSKTISIADYKIRGQKHSYFCLASIQETVNE